MSESRYDNNHLRRVVWAQGDSSYDRLIRLTGVDYPDDGTTSYTYDAVGRLLAVTTSASPSAKTVGYRYDQDGNRTTLIYPNSDAVTYAYD